MLECRVWGSVFSVRVHLHIDENKTYLDIYSKAELVSGSSEGTETFVFFLFCIRLVELVELGEFN